MKMEKVMGDTGRLAPCTESPLLREISRCVNVLNELYQDRTKTNQDVLQMISLANHVKEKSGLLAIELEEMRKARIRELGGQV